MRSPNSARSAQAGFSLMEVLTASMVLSIFILGIGASWRIADQRVDQLINRQKAVFIANSEMERLTVLYGATIFGTTGPSTTTSYDGPGYLPSTRLTYPGTGLALYIGPKDFTTTSANTFQTGSEFLVWVNAQLLPSMSRNFVWLNRGENVMARVSWTTTNISANPCTAGSDGCKCFSYLGLGAGSCQKLNLFLEYPYRLVSGNAVAGTTLETVTLSTIVGRHT